MEERGGFSPTRRVAAGGADWWAEPDPSRGAQGRLDAALPVEVLIETTGWAQIRCSNGWECWVDARNLTSIVHDAPASGAGAAPAGAAWPSWSWWCTVAGGVLVVAGSVLPWYSAGPVDLTAWDLRVLWLVTGEPSDVSVDAGPVLLVVVLGLIPLFTRRNLPGWAAMALAGVPVVLAVAGVLQYVDADPQPDLGVGLTLTVVGALVMGIGALISPRLLPHPLVRIR